MWLSNCLFLFLVPSAPRNVDVDVLNYHTIDIRWSPPSYPGGKITKYNFRLKYSSKEDARSGVKLQNFTKPPSQDANKERYYQFNHMLAYSHYEISIQEGAGNKPIWGNFSEVHRFEMPEGREYSNNI